MGRRSERANETEGEMKGWRMWWRGAGESGRKTEGRVCLPGRERGTKRWGRAAVGRGRREDAGN